MTTIPGKPVYLYNTLTRKKELFVPLDPPHVRIYSCGPTVYRDVHVGNFRAFMTPDFLRRMLEYNGYDVFLVRNITDVGHLHDEEDTRAGEDKLEYEARTTGKSAYEIADYYTRQYQQDANELNILPPQLNPKATDHILEMQAMIKQLIDDGLAYVTDEGNVYYDVSRFPEYGELSGNTVEQLREGGHGRQQMEIAEDKEAPEDFALWKRGEPTRQMNWPSLWGVGFPGWHIECSAMSTKYLGQQFDIHTGGIDLVFPHHEDEIAQSEGVNGKPPVRYWVHNEFLIFGSQKMARSKGNVVLVSTLKERGIEPIAFRYLLLTAHYRSKLHFTDASIAAAQNGLNNLREELAELLAAAPDAKSQDAGVWSPEARQARDAFHLAINDDMDLPTALGFTRETARNNAISPAERVRLLLDYDRVLGLRLDLVEAKGARPISEEALALVKERDAARAAKNWRRSDELREQLKALGFEVRDTAQGTQLM